MKKKYTFRPASNPELVKQLKNDYFDTNDVCELLGVSRRTVQAMRSNRTITHSKTGKVILYPVEAVKELINSNMKYRREKGKEE